MARRRPGYYSKKAGASLYPVKAGNVLATKENIRFKDRVAELYYEGRLYIWILSESRKREPGQRPKRRMIKVQYYIKLVGLVNGKNYFMPPIGDVQFESVLKWLRKGGGYELIAEGIRYYRHDAEDVARFFKAIGAV